MGNIVRKRRFIDVWRIGETESWLTDMAADGLHLKSLGRMFARFERGDPEKIRYRIDFSYNEYQTTDEQLKLYAENGWEYVCEQGESRVFRSPEAINAPEIHTEPAEQAFTLNKLSRRLTMSSIVITLLVAGVICMLGFAMFISKTPTLSLVEGQMINAPILFLLYPYMIFSQLQAAISIRRLMRSMREGRSIDHKAAWERHKRFYISAFVLMIPIASASIILPLLQITARQEEPLPLVNDNQMLLRLADIEQDPALERESYIYDDHDRANRIIYNWSPYAPVQIEAEEKGIIHGQMWPDGSGEYSPSLQFRLFKLNMPFMADGLITDLSKRIESWNDIHDEWYPVEEVHTPGVDRLLIRESGYFREVFARKGNIVIHALYYGSQDMDSLVEAVSVFMKSL